MYVNLWGICICIMNTNPLVGYLTPDSDLDLGALPPVRYINYIFTNPP